VSSDDADDDNVIVYMTTSNFPRVWAVLGVIVASADADTHATAVEKAKADFEKQAADLGAEAVLDVKLHTSGSGDTWGATSTGTAVFIPDDE
jgi:uncharacterized protein YbjQ (UPF0145 family)